MPMDCDKQTFTILGSGAAVPRLQRVSSANLLQKGPHMLLIDVGCGCLLRLQAKGVAVDRINHIFLTHLHPDHCAELVSLVFSRTGNLEHRWETPLHVYGGLGLKAWWRILCAAWPSLQKPIDAKLLVLHEIIAGETLDTDIWRIAATTVVHKPESLAYRFTQGGRSVVISGDTGPCNNLARFAHNADLLVLECGAGMNPAAGHLSLAQAADMATKARARNLILTHINHIDNVILLHAAFYALYRGPFQLASDLLTVEV